MKNSREYSQKIHNLYKTLKRKYPKPKKIVYDDPIDALVYAIVSEHLSNAAAKSAIKKFGENFVDLNDLRVSLSDEIVDSLGADTPVTRNTALTLTEALRSVFNKYNTATLNPLKKIGKRPAKQVLERMEGISLFAVSYCILTSMQGHAIPLTKKMVEYLKSNDLIHPEADEREIEGFLTKQIPAKNAYEFYALLRHQSESYKASPEEEKTCKTKTTNNITKKEKK